MSGVQCLLLSIPPGMAVSANSTAHYGQRHKLRNATRPQALLQARRMKCVERATIWAGVVKGNRNRYDPANLADTFKAGVDGIVEAGVLPDDSWRYVRGPWPFHLGYQKNLGRAVKVVLAVAPWSAALDDVMPEIRGWAERNIR